MIIDERLKQWATARQAQIIDAINKHGSKRGAARALKVHHSLVDHSMSALIKKAALAGYAPEADMHKPTVAPFVVKGTSTLYDELGNQKLQWVKTKLDEAQAAEAIQEWIASLTQDARGLSPMVPKPKQVDDELLAVYPLGDPHFGMYAWAEEAGEDFDLRTAERLTLAAVDRLVATAPAARVGLILPLGDFFHADDTTNQTPAHKNQLDVDSRYPKVLTVGIRAMRHCILRALEKHQQVIVRIEPGNHDPHAKWALTLALAAYFENNKRVVIDTSPRRYWFYRHGKVLIGSTHGDSIKIENMLPLMAAEVPEDWGQTRHRYWYAGHVHHEHKKEFHGGVVETFRTLAARDAYAAGHGYRAGRDMRLIIHHAEHGEIERHRVDVGML